MIRFHSQSPYRGRFFTFQTGTAGAGLVTPPLGVVGVAGVPGATGQQRRIAAAGQRLLAAQAGAAAVNQVSGVVGVVGSKRARMASSLDHR